MKTNEELNALKEEAEALNRKLAELTDEELAQVSGGDSVLTLQMIKGTCPDCLQEVISKINSAGTCSCGAKFYAGYCTMFTVDANNVYLKSFLNVESYS